MKLKVKKDVSIPADDQIVQGELCIPAEAHSLVIFAHGSGSSRFSPRNQMVASFLWQHNLGTLLFDLLTKPEDATYQNRFNIKLLAQRLIFATEWLQGQPDTKDFHFGYFGASTGAAAALMAAVALPDIAAVVSRGGRPDLAMEALYSVHAPTLLIVGGNDSDVLRLNQKALDLLHCEKKLEVVPGASHLFEEEGTMEQVCYLAASWFERYLLPRMIRNDNP
jgi:putative phosphoribosyl transferase